MEKRCCITNRNDYDCQVMFGNHMLNQERNLPSLGFSLLRRRKIMKFIDYPTINPNEEFQFECKNCGDCCRSVKNAVFLESLDLFRISKYLGLEISEVMQRYTDVCFVFEAFPMLVLKTKGEKDACVFLNKCKCRIHSAKPRTCRMYPLSAGFDKDDIQYVIASKKEHHFTGQKYTADDWMSECLSEEDRKFMRLDCDFAVEISKLINKIDDSKKDEVIRNMLLFRFCLYDTSEDFLSQFINNMQALKYKLAQLSK